MKKILHRYVNLFEELQSDTIDDLLSVVDEKFVFEDPFNRTKGKKEFKTLLKKMFRRLKNPKFKILKVYEHKLVSVIKWQFSCRFLKKKISFLGLSEIYLNNNLIIKHIDYWDSGKNFYTNLPFIGTIFKKFHK